MLLTSFPQGHVKKETTSPMQQHNKYPDRSPPINSVIILQFMIMLLFVKKTTGKSFVKECEMLCREMQKHWCISGGFFQEARIDRLAPEVEMGDLWCV